MIGCFARALFALIVLLPAGGHAAQPVRKSQPASSMQAMIETLKAQLQAHWSVPADLPGLERVRVRARLKLTRSGDLQGNPVITASGGPEVSRKALVASILRSITRAAPFKGLPRDRYNDWRDMVLNFDAAL
jgi:hypothetical protein